MEIVFGFNVYDVMSQGPATLKRKMFIFFVLFKTSGRNGKIIMEFRAPNKVLKFHLLQKLSQMAQKRK